ncbi:MAG: leucine-rich repeat protein [Clostridia bacterium]|nr:leucine-rich repeat protein [Clostridia bacterium]
MKKLLVLISVIIVAVIACVSFSASADDGTVVIDNVVYELTSQKYGKYDYGEHYVVTDFFYDESLAETTTKINIVDEINGIEVKAINTNSNIEPGYEIVYPECEDKYSPVKNINIPGNVKYIGDFAFNFFPNVERIYLPVELDSFGVGAFYEMKSLKTIIIPTSCRISDYAFYGCESLKKVVLPGDGTEIGNLAFKGCKNLSAITSPYSITSFGGSAFDDTAFKKIIIPENVDVLDEGGLISGSYSLEKIVFEDTSSKKEDYVEVTEVVGGRLPSVKGIYIKTIPTEGLSFGLSDLNNLPNLEKIYFAGSEEKWNELTSEPLREALELRGIEVEFYYRHSHSFKQSGKATCKNGGTYTYTCECGDSYKHSVDKAQVKHNYGSWKVTKKATYTATGTKQRTCPDCGKVEKRTLYKLKLDKVKKITYESTIDKITLSWDSVNGATGYRVYLYDRETGKDNKIASIKGKTSYTVKGLEKGYSYIFKVQPYNKDSKGNVVFGEKTTANTRTLATAPKNLVAVSEKTGVVKLTWESSGEWISYNVFFHTSKEDLIAGKTFEYPHYDKKETATIKNLESGKTYYFKVHINDETVDGVKTSNIVEVTVK